MDYQTKVFNSSRAYEYRMDDIRLTVLSLPDVIERIRQRFGFETAEVDSPPALFGPVPITAPPGLVFTTGVLSEGETPTLIRYLHVEQRRVVIGVAGLSSSLDEVFRQLNETTADAKAPDGTPGLGQPVGTIDHSAVSLQLPFSADRLLAPEFALLFEQRLEGTLPGTRTTLVPRLWISLEPADEEYRLADTTVQRAISLEIRPETNPSDRIYYSQAPLSSDEHLAFLANLATATAGDSAQD